jgi:tetratricopeptide (TPR) repeat protein
LRDLKSLTDKSLLQYTPSGRYQIHELLRQYAASKPSFLPDSREASANRHCAYYCTALHRWEKDLTSSRQQEALSEMEAERENIRAAWYWAVDQGKVSKLDQAMEGLEHFYWQSGRYRPGKAALQAAAAAANSDAAKSDGQVAWLRVSARALAWQSNFERAIGQRDTACQLQQRCLEVLQDPALAGVDTRLEHAILSWTMGATICMADYAQGRQRFEESLSLFRELDHLWGMAWALNASGTMSLFLGAYQEAESRLEEGLSIYRTLGNQAGVAGSLSRLASVASVKGHFEAAERLAREGFATSSQVGSRTQSALALLDLGLALENVAKFSEAHATLQQSLALFRDLGYRHYVTQAHSFMSSIDLHLGRYESARDHAQTGLTLAHEHGPPFCVALNLLLLGSLAMAEGDHAQAYRQLADAIPVTHDVGERADLSRAIAVLALAALDLGNSWESRQYLSQALGLAVELGAVPPLLWALPCASLLLAGQGEIERAVELYALACRYQLVAKSRWFADVAGNTLARVATTLPAERVVILQERGQVLDPMATAGELLADFSR